MASNVELLTHAHKVVKAKKRQKLGQIKAVVFDEDARREFLTGFHKRKVAKKEESKKRAQAREKEEHLEARREQRRLLAEQAAQNAAEVEEAYGGIVQRNEPDSDEEWTGITPTSSRAAADDPEHDTDAARRECEYSYADEEQLATVTVVEDFDPSALDLPPHGSLVGPEDARQERASLRPLPPPRREKVGNEGRSSGATSKRKRKDGSANHKVRYETKAARRAAQVKQRARRTEKAERAGGKSGRKKRKKTPMR